MHPPESLLDTFPGRLFIEHVRTFGGLGVPGDLISAATWSVGGYLHSDRYLEVADLDVDDPRLRELDAQAIAALSALPSFGSPQIHQGTVDALRAPTVSNRKALSALPDGAFWTSMPVTDSADSWTLCGENLRRGNPRWEVHFDVTRVRVARIDSARAWADLIDAHGVSVGGRRYPDWPAIAESWDAVHLSPAGLLLAHPKISTMSCSTADGSGYADCEAGPYVSVGQWSTVSTAWLREPPNVVLKPAPVVRTSAGGP